MCHQRKEDELKRKADIPMGEVINEELNDEEEEEANRFIGFLPRLEHLEPRDARLEALNRQADEMLVRLEQGVINMRIEIEFLNNVVENGDRVADDEGEMVQQDENENLIGNQVGNQVSEANELKDDEIAEEPMEY